jgi:hypothetical protein
MSLTVYLFDSITKEYAGIWNCQESPLEPGEYIVPTDSTTIENPTFDSKTQTCTWDNIQWVVADIPTPTPIPPEPPTADENKATAAGLLQQTDWTQIPSVSDPALSNPYLDNKLAFDQYRNEVRQYAVYPVEGIITWPVIPTETWIKV